MRRPTCKSRTSGLRGKQSIIFDMAQEYEYLKLSNQLCFPLYACANEVIKLYKPVLDPLDLTYTQYITMLALWENDTMSVKKLGELLHLDSGTLTPVLKKLEGKGYIKKERSALDERSVNVTVTEQGVLLKQKAAEVPLKVGSCIALTKEEATALYTLTHKLLNSFDE